VDGAVSIRAIPIAQVRDCVKVADAARISGVSPGTVRVWAEAGRIPVHKNSANGYRLFKRFELEAFLADVEKPALPTKPK
jgi:predicted site-specific integrase-resolvase